MARTEEPYTPAPWLVATENGAATYSSSSARLDFFFNVLEGTPAQQVHDLLAKVSICRTCALAMMGVGVNWVLRC